jgi:peptide/nickel transport system permease protein
VLQAIPLLLGIATLLFVVMRIAPGDPIEMYVQKHRETFATGRPFDPKLEQFIRHKYGLDRPVPVQYVIWLRNLAHGDLGESFQYHRPVSTLIAERLPYTLQLTILALVLGAAIGISLGILSAVKQHSAIDKAVTLGSLIMYSIPEFWLGVMFILLFAVTLRWFPVSQTRSLDYLLFSTPGRILDRLWHQVLPVMVLALGSAAGTARYMRSELLGVLNEEYVIAARARGLPETRVVLRHALRNALMPIVTIYGLALPFLVGGAAVVEKIFGWPGMGALAVDAVGARDYPVIMATSMIAAVLVVAGNLLADVLYVVVDPRVSFDGRRTG